jgi:flagellar biosynthesis chaperone FliJ
MRGASRADRPSGGFTMDFKPEKYEQESHESSPAPQSRSWIVVAVCASLLTTAIALGYGVHQQSVVGQLTSQNQEMTSAMNEMHSKVDTLNAKMNDVSSQAAAAVTALQQQAATQNGGKGVSAKQRAASSRQLKQLQAALTDQQKELKDTQDQIAKNRTDLEGALSSTKDELNGSIATTHEELVALQKRGERNYFEFDITKSKSFQREGPLSLSLRKADTKNKSYDIAMIVDDNQLTKKKINLYEPVWIHRTDDPQPVQIVVNKIGKNSVHGYVSAPKYRNSELSSTLQNVSEKRTSPDSSTTYDETVPYRPQ